MISKLVKGAFLNSRPTRSVAGAALIISLAGIASRLLGLFRDRILAATFGAGDVLDIYYAAFRIPDLVYNLLILGALSAAFIPVFTELITKNKEEEAWKAANGLLSVQIVGMGILAAVLAIFAPQIMRLMTPGFGAEKMEAVTHFTRIMFLSPILLGISGIFGGILVSLKKFLIYSLAPIFYNIGIIIGALVLVPLLGPIGLAWGVVFGAFLHMLVQYPAVKRSGFSVLRYPGQAISDKNVRQIGKLMLPRMLGIAVSQVSLLVITVFASTMASGSLAVFYLANNIQSAPLGLFGISFAIAVFPTLSALAAKSQSAEFSLVITKTLRQILFFVIPASAMIFVLRAQIVRVVLGSGKFDWEDTILTFQTLGILVGSLFAQSLIPLFTRAFYALQDTRTPLYIALFAEALTIGGLLFLAKPLGVYGLALAFSLSSLAHMVLLAACLKKRSGGIFSAQTWQATGRIVLATAIAASMAQLGKVIVGTKGELDTFVEVLTQLAVALSMGAGAFALASHYLGIEEFFRLMHSVSRKVFQYRKNIRETTEEVAL
ncbi:MAG TPA: murein biosynthesis integral membrane protein MurJ [Candidatus Moranbacteria bacterium]|nr:murein biosynthesis integral membrane protein MurJ [Candidatus Moranbacteria bacterium]